MLLFGCNQLSQLFDLMSKSAEIKYILLLQVFIIDDWLNE